MELRKNGYELSVRAESLPHFEQQTLMSGLCDFLLPMKFVRYGEDVKAIYDCSGYAALDELKFRKAFDIFDLLEKILMNIARSGEFLIDPAKVTLSEDTIYYDANKREIKFLYLPRDGWMKESGIEGLVTLFSKHADENARGYLAKFLLTYRKYNMNVEAAAAYAGELRREIFERGIS